jgi:hypothetical protein
MVEANNLRRFLIGGQLVALEHNDFRTFGEWRKNTWKLLIFVSSTFTDTHRERDYLLKVLQPKLGKQIARKNHIEFSFIDTR